MKISLKHFALGTLLAAMPTFYYVKANIALNLKPKPKILAYQSDYLSPEVISYSLKHASTKEEMPTPTLKPSPQQKVVHAQTTPTPIPTQTAPQSQTASYVLSQPHTPNEVSILIEKYAGFYRVNKDMMVVIAKCESGFRDSAVNGPYAGIYQFLASTWASNRQAMGLDTNPQLRYNLEESIKTAAFKMARDGFGAWPVCQQKAKEALSVNIN